MGREKRGEERQRERKWEERKGVGGGGGAGEERNAIKWYYSLCLSEVSLVLHLREF